MAAAKLQTSSLVGRRSRGWRSAGGLLASGRDPPGVRVDNSSEGIASVSGDKPRAAGDVVIGGLRCDRCRCLFRPDKDQTSETCQRCRYYALLRERFREGNDKRALR